ncbi:hypothetical protein, partial [Pseudomonas syringae]
MLIKFKKPDPRAGLTVQLDSSLAQKFLDEGRATQVGEGAEAAPEPDPPANDTGAPAAKKTAAKR